MLAKVFNLNLLDIRSRFHHRRCRWSNVLKIQVQVHVATDKHACEQGHVLKHACKLRCVALLLYGCHSSCERQSGSSACQGQTTPKLGWLKMWKLSAASRWCSWLRKMNEVFDRRRGADAAWASRLQQYVLSQCAFNDAVQHNFKACTHTTGLFES